MFADVIKVPGALYYVNRTTMNRFTVNPNNRQISIFFPGDSWTFQLSTQEEFDNFINMLLTGKE